MAVCHYFRLLSETVHISPGSHYIYLFHHHFCLADTKRFKLSVDPEATTRSDGSIRAAAVAAVKTAMHLGPSTKPRPWLPGPHAAVRVHGVSRGSLRQL